jgi:hypothetical protein
MFLTIGPDSQNRKAPGRFDPPGANSERQPSLPRHQLPQPDPRLLPGVAVGGQVD